MSVLRVLQLFIISLFIAGCSKTDLAKSAAQQQDEAANADPNIVNILFIGNSLTFFNSGIDFHVQQFYTHGTQSGRTIEIDERTLPGYTLQQHLGNPGTQTKLNSKVWDIVVLQENGHHATQKPKEALEAMKSFQARLEGTPTRVFLFMTWAYEGEPEMTKQLQKLYYQAASETGFPVLPVGLGWRDVTAANPGFDLLSSDGVHPSLQGTYFSAAIIFEILSNQKATTNEYQPQMPESQAIYLKGAASQTVADYY